MNLIQLRAAKNAARKSYNHLNRANAPLELRIAAREHWLMLEKVYKEEVRLKRYSPAERFIHRLPVERKG